MAARGGSEFAILPGRRLVHFRGWGTLTLAVLGDRLLEALGHPRRPAGSEVLLDLARARLPYEAWRMAEYRRTLVRIVAGAAIGHWAMVAEQAETRQCLAHAHLPLTGLVAGVDLFTTRAEALEWLGQPVDAVDGDTRPLVFG